MNEQTGAVDPPGKWPFDRERLRVLDRFRRFTNRSPTEDAVVRLLDTIEVRDALFLEVNLKCQRTQMYEPRCGSCWEDRVAATLGLPWEQLAAAGQTRAATS